MAKKKKETPVTAPTRFQGTPLTALDATIRCTGIAVGKAGLYALGAPLEIAGATMADMGAGVELFGARAKRKAAKLSFKRSIQKAAYGEMQRSANSDARRAARRAKQADAAAAKQAKQAAKQNDNLGLVEPELV